MINLQWDLTIVLSGCLQVIEIFSWAVGIILVRAVPESIQTDRSMLIQLNEDKRLKVSSLSFLLLSFSFFSFSWLFLFELCQGFRGMQQLQ